jgi:hypothetical protein
MASFPFIWFMIIPIIILDVCLEIYHHICFPLYGIALVKRKDFVKLDRHELAYLSFFDKINCTYCAYANGMAHYLTEIAGRTEKYWCGVKHQVTKGFREPQHHSTFLAHGDERAYKQKCKLSRKK